ncbi:hypothetical protein SBV1_1930070 [Verrucomicrobia bacterium]|nr:hypothetical protein SBV1_1930070 [Verrucomicrobiota bacterium]
MPQKINRRSGGGHDEDGQRVLPPRERHLGWGPLPIFKTCPGGRVDSRSASATLFDSALHFDLAPAIVPGMIGQYKLT